MNPKNYKNDLFREEEPTGVLEELAECGEIRFFESGEKLYSDGVKVENLYLILQGQVNAYFVEDGKRRLVRTFDVGSILGFNGILSLNRHATMLCVSPCIIAILPIQILESAETRIVLSLIKLQTAKSGYLLEQLLDISFNNGEKRFLQYLIQASEETPGIKADNIPVYIQQSEQEIADRIGTTKKYVSTLKKKLSSNGLLTSRSGGFIYYPSNIRQLLVKMED